jgi:hypothetical protein
VAVSLNVSFGSWLRENSGTPAEVEAFRKICA